ncbi:MAG: hypothetical protein Q9219_006049 [cf. Caloplaca sp. 3 TL-2023]
MSSISSNGPNSCHAILIQAVGKGDESKAREALDEVLQRSVALQETLRVALQRAVGRGHEPLTRLLLSHGAPVNIIGEGEVFPLHRAAEMGRENILRQLLDSGANVDNRDRNQRTAIFAAAQKVQQNCLSLLLDAGANVNLRDREGQTLLLFLAADKSFLAADRIEKDERRELRSVEIIKTLLRANPDLEVKDKEGRTALLWAAATGKVSLARHLVGSQPMKGASIKATNNRGKTALHLAVDRKSHRHAMVELLLQTGADVHSRSDGGWTPLHNAAEKGYEDVASLLLNWKADVNAATSSGMTALHWCARNGHINVVKLLLQQPGIRRHRKDFFDESAMLGAAQNGHIEIAHLLSPTRDGDKLSTEARAACDGFQATVVDFGMEHRPMNHKKHSVFDVLYGWDESREQPAVTTIVRNIPAKPAFRWIHLPTNNIAWVETLLTKYFIENSASDVDGFKALEKLLGQQHRGPTVHSFFMRPQCRRMPPTGKDAPPAGKVSADTEGPRADLRAVKPLMILPDQAPANNRSGPKSDSRADRKSKQSEQKPRAATTPNSTVTSMNDKKTEHGAKSPLPQKRKAERRVSRTNNIDRKPERKGNIVLFMPYLHYETHRNRVSMSQAIKQATTSKTGDSHQLPERSCDEMLIHAYLGSTPHLHIRRTLDQSYYHAISTEDRDNDQVVYRFTKRKLKEKKIFMVDQLWLWVLGNDLIITSFPQRWEQPKNDPLNVLDGVIEDMNSKTRPPIRSVHDLATLITSRCSGVFGRHRLGDENYQFLDMFESSIGEVTEQETQLFKNFNQASKAAAAWLKSQRQKGNPANDMELIKDFIFVDTLLDIDKETALLAEVKDIRDELNMISMVLKHQVSLLDGMMSALLEEVKGSQNQQTQHEIKRRYREQQKVVEVHLRDIERMDKQAESIYTSVSRLSLDCGESIIDGVKQLTHLLDLKQKHANAFEARFARDQAAFTGRQGQTIMVFTIVTIVFLPMSFIAAVFAIPVRDFPHVDGAPSLPFSYVSKIMFGVGLAISIPLIAVAFALDNLGEIVRSLLRSLSFWRRPNARPITNSQGSPRQDMENEDIRPTLVGRMSGDSFRRKLSYDVAQETRAMRRSIYSKDRSFRDEAEPWDRTRRSDDLEKGGG